MTDILNLEPFRVNDDITAIRHKLERMRLAFLTLRPVPSGTITARITSGGTMFDVRTRPQGEGGVGGPQPFDITVGGTAGAHVATFYPGVINQLFPSNCFSGVSIPDTGTRFLSLDVTASNGQMTTASLSASASPPSGLQPNNGQPPTGFSILIGAVVNLVVFQIWEGNIQATSEESFRLQKVTPVAGQVPYDIYYTWNFAAV